MHPDSLLDALLFEAEGAELDFKREQYAFEGADDREKSELLKDILAFANAWRRTDAFILIGVQEVKEGESMVIGIEKHIDDAKLQQFVNAKTSRPVLFSYTPTQFRSKQIGVIHIPIQERPVFLLKDYGRLNKNVVYLRRGSSTDEARPDEVARMGQAFGEGLKLKPLLTPMLATGSDWSELTESTSFESMSLLLPDIKDLPDYSPRRETGPFGMAMYLPMMHVDSDFYRDRAEYFRFGSKLRPIRFSVRNDGTALASGVKLVIRVDDPEHVIEIVPGSDQPKPPRREWSPLDNIRPISLSQPAPDIEVVRTNAGWTITAFFGKIQAKDSAVTSDELFIGRLTSGAVALPSSVFADELSSPVNSTLLLTFAVSERTITTDDLTR
jgi:hypothetical protein